VRTIKNFSQLAGIACIGAALYTAWASLPVKDAIMTSLATLTTSQGPGADVQIVMVAREMPAQLLESPLLLLGAMLILVPYIAQVALRTMAQPQPRGRY